MDYIIENLSKLNDEEAREYISMLFDGYINRKKENRLFEHSAKIPVLIILTYYACVKKPLFTNIYHAFKEKYLKEDNIVSFKENYIYNENKVEEVHSVEEKQGLRIVYDYIQEKENFEDISIYTLSDIHEMLYSKSPYPEFGGKYRNDSRFLPNTGIDITPHYYIVHEMNQLRDEVSDIVKEGIELGKKVDPKKIMGYIDKCIELKCKLIKIHPFGDGNGRSIRAFINLLFRLANIPPVYIEKDEKLKYSEAMNVAIGDEDLSKIKGFYYYKICDSIISLDFCIKKDGKFVDEENNIDVSKGSV